MIRTVLFKVQRAGASEFTEGVLHNITGNTAVVEDLATGELHAIPVSPVNIKFKMLMPDWVKLQVEAQSRAKAESVKAPSVNFMR